MSEKTNIPAERFSLKVSRLLVVLAKYAFRLNYVVDLLLGRNVRSRSLEIIAADPDFF